MVPAVFFEVLVLAVGAAVPGPLAVGAGLGLGHGADAPEAGRAVCPHGRLRQDG